jgi:hypothetical protein
VQIPNATAYNATITNFTANPIARYDFTVGIGYDDSIAKAQAEALRVLTEQSRSNAQEARAPEAGTQSGNGIDGTRGFGRHHLYPNPAREDHLACFADQIALRRIGNARALRDLLGG